MFRLRRLSRKERRISQIAVHGEQSAKGGLAARSVAGALVLFIYTITVQLSSSLSSSLLDQEWAPLFALSMIVSVLSERILLVARGAADDCDKGQSSPIRANPPEKGSLLFQQR